MKRFSSDDMPADDRAIQRKAADWIGVRDAGLTTAQARELDTWLSADPRHAAAFARLDSTSRALDRLHAYRPHGLAEPDPDLPLRPRRVHRFTRLRLRSGLVAMAAAAAVAIAYLSPWQRPDAGNFRETAATEIGGLRKMKLPDGSVLDLNTDSAVKVAFDAAERHVELTRGEAHFAVAKDPSRPFVVQVGAVRLQAVGTAFSVRLRSEAVELLVTEGKVVVHDWKRDKSLLPEAPSAVVPVLEAGQRAVIATPIRAEAIMAPAMVAAVTAVEIAQKLAWQEKRLEFGPTPLQDVVAEFNRYSVHRLVVVDPVIAKISLGGSFRAGDWETLVRLLESNFDVAAERSGQDILLRGR